MVATLEHHPLVIDVREYGAAGDGVTDDTVEVQAAIDACGEAGGGTVYFPSGEYLLGTRSGGPGGAYWALNISYDNVHLVGAGRGATTLICDTTGDCQMLFIAGDGKVSREDIGDISEWYKHTLWPLGDGSYGHTLYDLDGTTLNKGDRVLTLDTAADAANFAVGDWIGFGTGNLTAASFSLPDGELQRIESINVGGGTITVEHGFKTDYAQEYFISGTTGVTSTTPTANPCPFVVVNASDCMIEDISVSEMTLDQRKLGPVFMGGHSINFWVHDVDCICNGYGFSSFGRSRYHRVEDVHVRIYDTLDSYWITADSTCTDFDWVNITMEADAPSNIHINEGTGRVRVKNVSVNTPSVSGNHALLGVNGRGYDVDLDGLMLSGGGSTAVVFVDPTNPGEGTLCGRARNCTINNSEFAVAFGGMEALPGWVVEHEGPNQPAGGVSYFAVVQSTDSPLTLPACGSMCVVANVANITSIDASWVGRVITLIFNNTASGTGLTDGSNLKLASNLVYTPDDTITLVCDGTNWYEVGRSVN